MPGIGEMAMTVCQASMYMNALSVVIKLIKNSKLFLVTDNAIIT